MQQPQSALPDRAREVALTGPKAIQWLDDLGWRAAPTDPFHLFADLVRWDPFALGRIWHTPGTFTLHGNHVWPDDVFLAVLAIDGEQTVHTADTRVSLPAGGLFIQRLNQPFRIESTVPAARLVMVSEWSRIGLSRTECPVTVADPEYAKVFISAVNAKLNSAAPPTDAGFVHTRRGIESLFAAMLAVESDAGDAGDLDVSLIERARRHMITRASDVRFDVRRLIAELSTSHGTLYRAFDAIGSSPARELRALRTAAARSELRLQAERGVRDLAAVAAAVGFGSVRSLQRALVNDLGRPDAADVHDDAHS